MINFGLRLFITLGISSRVQICDANCSFIAIAFISKDNRDKCVPRREMQCQRDSRDKILS